MAVGLSRCEYHWFLRWVFCMGSTNHRLSWVLYRGNYLRSTNFRGYIFSRISHFLAIFAKLNTREVFLNTKFTKINTREIFLQLKFAKFNTREEYILSGREDKKDITFKIPCIYFQNLIGYNCITSFVFLSKHALNFSWPNFRLLFIFCAWWSLTWRTLVGSHKIVHMYDG